MRPYTEAIAKTMESQVWKVLKATSQNGFENVEKSTRPKFATRRHVPPASLSTTYAGRSYRSRIVHLACLIPICLLETIVVISKWTLFSHVEKFNT